MVRIDFIQHITKLVKKLQKLGLIQKEEYLLLAAVIMTENITTTS
jgi:uncharacterized protein YqgQ